MPPTDDDYGAAAGAAEVLRKFEERYPSGLITEERATLVELVRGAIASALWRHAKIGPREDSGGGGGGSALLASLVNPGDVVRLRSGGPLMTAGDVHKGANIIGLRLGGAVACFWHDDELKAASGLFPPSGLERLDPRTPPLLDAAKALWEHPNEHAGVNVGVFDYIQDAAGVAAIERFLAALNDMDSGDRAWALAPHGE